MSLYTMNNDKYHFRMGADRVTSAFFQVWAQPHDDQDTYLVGADNTGVHIYGEVPPVILLKIEELKKRFEINASKGRTNIDYATIDDIARRLGFPLSKRHNMYAYYDDFDYEGRHDEKE